MHCCRKAGYDCCPAVALGFRDRSSRLLDPARHAQYTADGRSHTHRCRLIWGGADYPDLEAPYNSDASTRSRYTKSRPNLRLLSGARSYREDEPALCSADHFVFRYRHCHLFVPVLAFPSYRTCYTQVTPLDCMARPAPCRPPPFSLILDFLSTFLSRFCSALSFFACVYLHISMFGSGGSNERTMY